MPSSAFTEASGFAVRSAWRRGSSFSGNHLSHPAKKPPGLSVAECENFFPKNGKEFTFGSAIFEWSLQVLGSSRNLKEN